MVNTRELKKKIITKEDLENFKSMAQQVLVGNLVHENEISLRDEYEDEEREGQNLINIEVAKKYYLEILSEINNVSNAMLRIGVLLNQADDYLPENMFQQLVKAIDLDKSTIAKLRKIARDSLIMNNLNKLPSSHWSTLHELSKLHDYAGDKKFISLINKNILTTKTKRVDVVRIISSTKKPVIKSPKKKQLRVKISTIYYLNGGLSLKEAAKERKKLRVAINSTLAALKLKGGTMVE